MFINLFINFTKSDDSPGCFNATLRIRKLEIHQIKVLVYDHSFYFRLILLADFKSLKS